MIPHHASNRSQIILSCIQNPRESANNSNFMPSLPSLQPVNPFLLLESYSVTILQGYSCEKFIVIQTMGYHLFSWVFSQDNLKKPIHIFLSHYPVLFYHSTNYSFLFSFFIINFCIYFFPSPPTKMRTIRYPACHI